jgi:hypothetical protein
MVAGGHRTEGGGQALGRHVFVSYAAAENPAYVARFQRDLAAALRLLADASAARRTAGPPLPGPAVPGTVPGTVQGTEHGRSARHEPGTRGAVAAPGTAGVRPGPAPRGEPGEHGGSADADRFAEPVVSGQGPGPGSAVTAATADVMVALCSEAYYADPGCGRDWAVFERRLTLRRPVRPAAPDPLVLVRWQPADPPPGIPRAPVHCTDVVADYASIGLLGIMHRRGRRGPQYQAAVERTAAAVHEGLTAPPPVLPPGQEALLPPSFPLLPPPRRPRDERPAAPPPLPDGWQHRAATARPRGRLYFISYAAPDLPWARYVEYHVRMLGHRTEMDIYDWQPGTQAARRRAEALGAADAVLALISDAYLRDGPTAADWADTVGHFGPGGEPRLLPLLIEDVELPPLLRGLVTATLAGLDAADAQEAIRAAVSGRGRYRRPDGEPELPRS